MLKKIIPPDTCPSCDSSLEWVNDQLYCTSPDCGSKLYKKIEHFAKTLKIKGLGPATIQKLDIKQFTDIYELEKAAMVSALGERVTDKLLSEIERSKNSSLNEVLPAFGIPLIGRTASGKVCNVVKHIDDIDLNSCEEAGLGPKATESLIQWLDKAHFLRDLPFKYNSEEQKQKETVEIKGVVCISGRLTSFKTKAQATEALEEKGFVVKSSLTKDVTTLINESGIASAKTQKAQDMGINVITNIKEFLKEI